MYYFDPTMIIHSIIASKKQSLTYYLFLTNIQEVASISPLNVSKLHLKEKFDIEDLGLSICNYFQLNRFGKNFSKKVSVIIYLCPTKLSLTSPRSTTVHVVN